MSNQATETDQGQSGSGINPAWKQYLDQVPEVLRPQIAEVFKQWDAGVQQKLQSEREKYAGADKYKEIIQSGMDPQFISQAVTLATQLQQDPQAMTERIHKTFGLKYVPEQQAQQQSSSSGSFIDDNEGSETSVDITKHPQFQEMYQMMQTMQQQQNMQQQDWEQQRIAQEFEAELDELEERYKDKGGVNRLLVTAFMSQGLTGDEAVAQYHQALAGNTSADEIINQQQTQQQSTAPVFMGSGDGGNGIPASTPPSFGDMNKGDVSKMVADYIAKSATPD